VGIILKLQSVPNIVSAVKGIIFLLYFLLFSDDQMSMNGWSWH